jgi:hypothetical protein
MLSVHVCKDTLVHHHNAVQNVLSARNVHRFKRVSTKNVWIHVVVLAVTMLAVKYVITVQFAVATKVKREIHSKDVMHCHHLQRI